MLQDQEGVVSPWNDALSFPCCRSQLPSSAPVVLSKTPAIPSPDLCRSGVKERARTSFYSESQRVATYSLFLLPSPPASLESAPAPSPRRHSSLAAPPALAPLVRSLPRHEQLRALTPLLHTRQAIPMTFLHDERSAPGYLTVRSTSNHLSEYHPTALSPEALHLLNQTLDALLYATVQSAFSPSSSSPVSPGKTGGVQAGVGLSAQQFKAAFLRVVNNQRAKDALLEADLSLSFAGSPGLKPFILSSSTTATTAEATFVSLRAALTPLPINSIVPPLAPLPQYVRTTLSEFTERILRSLLQIIDREAVGKDHVGVDELRVLISEDEKGWAWIKETKVWRDIQGGAVGGSRDSGDGWGNAKGRGSYEKGGTAMGRALSDDVGHYLLVYEMDTDEAG